MDNIFEECIEEHIQSNLFELKKDKIYSQLNNTFYKNYQYLFSKLEKKDQQTFEDTFDSLLDIYSKESSFSYKIGFVDGIKLDKDLKEMKTARKH